jgi:hypothetical protein
MNEAKSPYVRRYIQVQVEVPVELDVVVPDESFAEHIKILPLPAADGFMVGFPRFALGPSASLAHDGARIMSTHVLNRTIAYVDGNLNEYTQGHIYQMAYQWVKDHAGEMDWLSTGDGSAKRTAHMIRERLMSELKYERPDDLLATYKPEDFRLIEEVQAHD